MSAFYFVWPNNNGGLNTNRAMATTMSKRIVKGKYERTEHTHTQNDIKNKMFNLQSNCQKISIQKNIYEYILFIE